MAGARPVSCSFCGRPEAGVQKLIAGPGVYICDGCVQACNEILDARCDSGAPRVPAWESMTDEQVLDHLPRIAAVGAQVEASLQGWVMGLRERGVSWARIGSALSMTRQSAWERFFGRDPESGSAA